MIDLNPDIVTHIAALVRDFQTRASMADDADSASEPIDGSSEAQLERWSGDPEYLELKSAIEDLEPDQQSTLVALMWLGRGDYDDWEAALEYANEASGVTTADYLIATPLLADYLEEGLSLHGYED